MSRCDRLGGQFELRQKHRRRDSEYLRYLGEFQDVELSFTGLQTSSLQTNESDLCSFAASSRCVRPAACRAAAVGASLLGQARLLWVGA